MAYADSRAIDALKIVCDNHNNDVIDEASELLKGEELFRDKCAVLEKDYALLCGLLASQRTSKSSASI